MAQILNRDTALFHFLTRIGDSTLILGHRVSEWCGHSPMLEEDIALANTALDLIGHTRMWLGLAAEVEGKGRSADDLAFLRDSMDFTNLLLVEQPNGDFGQTMMRQLLFDAWHLPYLNALKSFPDPRVAGIAEKATKEVAYHVDRAADLVVRLGDGTHESHTRMQAALDELWPCVGEMFSTDEVDAMLAPDAPKPDRIRDAWDATILPTLARATLAVPATRFTRQGGKTGRHSEHLGHVLAQMQFLQRAYPGATW
ncbi:MAG: phenylacetate-CoA oxygenase subunit PaaC [Rhodobacteraceae bacterium]|nr:phenylacetate-CoA oxygenase subunit PaaC [Paracoccaceae bacterium]